LFTPLKLCFVEDIGKESGNRIGEKMAPEPMKSGESKVKWGT
jgi:hypothetical protein